MKMSWLIIVGIVFALIVMVIVAGILIAVFDLMSYTAMGRMTVSPAEPSAGHALVVYSPGISGGAKNSAEKMADDLKARGYMVELAGVRSTSAVNSSGYDIVIAGGPMYYGKVCRSIGAYLKDLKLSKNTRLGVFATTGSSQFHDDDILSFEKQIRSLISNSPAEKEIVIKTLRNGDANSADCSDFVSTLLR